MAGMHFIILKVNGVDVSQMPHEEAVQMFLKASEPILVEVRRRSYNGDSTENTIAATETYESSNETPNQKETSRRQPSIISLMTSPVRHQKLPCDYQSSVSAPKTTTTTTATPKTATTTTTTTTITKPTTTATTTTFDSIQFQNLIISSSQSSLGIGGTASNRRNRTESSSNKNCSGGGSPLLTAVKRNYNTGDTTCSQSNNQTQPTFCSVNDSSSSSNPTFVKSSSAPISSATSPAKSIPSSPAKESSVMQPSEDCKTNKGFVSVGIQTDTFATDFIFSGTSMMNPDQIIDNEHNLFSECLAPEIDIEEITLRKSESNERLGLTVCYSSGGGNGSGSDDTDTCTEVYISDIVPDSIAGRDGRLRQGDQILQVNGKDVSNKEETETLIAENNNAVTLLVSRYLYGDDDEFNEQDGDFYDEDEPSNLAYANCFLENYLVSQEDVVKSVPGSNQSSPGKKLSVDDCIQNEQINRPIFDGAVPNTKVITDTTTSTTSSSDPLHHQNIRAHLEQVHQEIAILDSRVENMMLSQHAKPQKNVEASCSVQKTTKDTTIATAMPIIDYDTEHIYETIPEDSESEPFYCSPYESSEHQNRIEQWLGMHDGVELNESNRIRPLPQKLANTQQNHDNTVIWTKAKNGTLLSTTSSIGDDHENSSSAYNTGGSCNSNTMTALTLELNANYRDREHHSQSTLILCPTKHAISPINETINHHRPATQSSTQELTSHRYSKEKLLSPTHSSKTSQPFMPNKQKAFPVPQKNSDVAKSTSQNTPISASNTMYTNVANLQQTMLLQQQLFRQALIQQRVPSNTVPCPQFTAPNLSQYHFVSSQEVSTVKLNTHPNEEHMVWKVKRRQDGTRYIVRRPARNRFLRNRAMRISAERNDQTTEDDTISEIKTGRYWTKEERKKHIERARERRQRQQIIITNKNNEISPLLNTNTNVNDKPLLQSNLDLLQQTSQQKHIPPIQSLSTPTATKVYRQSTPTGQSFTKKIGKKNILTNSSADTLVTTTSSNAITGAGSAGTAGNSTLKSTAAAPSGGNRMLQGVADNTYQSRVIHPPM